MVHGNELIGDKMRKNSFLVYNVAFIMKRNNGLNIIIESPIFICGKAILSRIHELTTLTYISAAFGKYEYLPGHARLYLRC